MSLEGQSEGENLDLEHQKRRGWAKMKPGEAWWPPRTFNYHKINAGHSKIEITQCTSPPNGQYLMTGGSSWTQAESPGFARAYET